jgi:hypothetical protein
MRLCPNWNKLSLRQRETVRHLDHKYYDSDLEDVEEAHLRFRENGQRAVYFIENRALKGYAVIRTLYEYAFIIWFVAPKCGTECLRKLLRMRSVKGKEVRLYVSCFPEKAYEARLKLFKQAGFAEYKTRAGSGVAMRRPYDAPLNASDPM